MPSFEFNEDAIENIHHEVADNLQLADQGLRDKGLLGKPVEAIKPLAAEALATAGVTLPDEKLTEYAKSISGGEDYEFVLD